MKYHSVIELILFQLKYLTAKKIVNGRPGQSGTPVAWIANKGFGLEHEKILSMIACLDLHVVGPQKPR